MEQKQEMQLKVERGVRIHYPKHRKMTGRRIKLLLKAVELIEEMSYEEIDTIFWNLNRINPDKSFNIVFKFKNGQRQH